MTKPYEPRRIKYEFLASLPLYDGRVLGAVLDALCAVKELAPEKYGTDERRLVPFDLAQFPREAGEPSEIALYFARAKRIKYRPAVVSQHEFPSLTIDFDARMQERDYETVFAAADGVAAACEPDFALVHFSSHVSLPSTREADRVQKVIDLATDLQAVDWKAFGPRGLGMRTYIGPRLLEQLDRARVLQLPVPVEELRWGGVRIDLAPDPWRATQTELHTGWQTAMSQLAPAGVFATHELVEGRAVRFTRGPRFVNVAVRAS